MTFHLAAVFFIGVLLSSLFQDLPKRARILPRAMAPATPAPKMTSLSK
jgi:hypothetical protein